MDDEGGGATAAARGEKAKDSAEAACPASRVSGTSGGESFECVAQGLGERRIEIFIGAGPQGYQDELRSRIRMKDEDCRLRRGILQAANEFFERHRNETGF